MTDTATLESAAAELVALKDVYYAATKASGDAARADHLTGEHIEAVIAAGEKVDEACEDFRRHFFPRVHKVVTAGGEVFTVSRTGRSIRRVYERVSS